MNSTALQSEPKINHRLWPIVESEEEAAVLAVLRRGVFSGGNAPAAAELEAEFARYVEAEHALLTHSGTSALILSLAANGVGPDDEVIMPAYSFVATPIAALQLGAVPIFVDVKAPHYNVDPAQVEAAITPRTKAIMPVHIHGCPADMDALWAIARKHDLRIIEDAAQAHGAIYKDRPVGALGHAGGFSLQSSKNLGAGEGGVFVTNDAQVAERANQIRNFGQNLGLSDRGFNPDRPLDGTRALDSIRGGQMYRGNEMMAAFALSQLKKLPARTAKAQANARMLADRLAALPGVTPPTFSEDRTSVHHKYRVELSPEEAGVNLSPTELRDRTRDALIERGLEVVYWEGKPLPAQGVFQTRELGPLQRADAARLAQNYDPARYPVTQSMLDSSLLLFSQSRPLIAQDAEVVTQYADIFEAVWHERGRWTK